MKQLAPLEEERPLLRKEERLAWIERELAGIRFDLRVIGLDRAVQSEVVGDAPPHVPADLRVARVVGVAARGGVTGGLPGGLGIDVHDQATVHAREADQVSRLSNERGAGAARRKPRVLEAGMLHLPDDVETPVLRLLGLIAETLERDPHLDFVTPRRQAAVRLEDVIRTQVRLLAPDDRAADEAARRDVGPLDQRAVTLHAQRVDREHQRLLAVVECAEQNLHIVVAKDLIAVGERRGGTAMQLVGANPEVDGVARVPDQDLRRVDGRNTVVRRVLREAGQERGVRPCRIPEIAVDDDVGLHTGDPHLELARAARVDSWGVREGAVEDQA